MWVYIIVTLTITTQDIDIPCPNNIEGCQTYHYKTVTDTVKTTRGKFCERPIPFGQTEIVSTYPHTKTIVRIDSIWVQQFIEQRGK